MRKSEELIQAFNSKHNRRYPLNKGPVRRRFDYLLENYSYEDILHSIETSDNNDAMRLRVARCTPTASPAANDPAAALNALEKAIAATLAEKYVPNLVAKVMEAVESKTGPLVREISFSFEGRSTAEGQVFHEEFETVATLVAADEPVMLVGPAGTGKNVICQQIADLMSIDFYFTNSVTQEFKLTGFIDASGRYHETEFYKAFTNGGLFFLDEIDASIPEALITLNAAIANRYFDFPTGRVNAHPDFRLIAAANTFGTGADLTYTGRFQLDGASLNRFAVVEIGYSPHIENSITTDAELLEFVRGFRKASAKLGLNHVVSYRDLSRLNKVIHGSELPLGKVIKVCLTKGLQRDELTLIKNKLPVKNKYVHAMEV